MANSPNARPATPTCGSWEACCPDLPTENRKRVERVLGVFTREQDLRDGIARYKQCRDRLKELTDAHGDEIAAGVDSMVAREARSPVHADFGGA